ncbi:unnamed protein product, partial [Staurois parvus]
MTQGPHDPLLPVGPMSCQSAPALSTAATGLPFSSPSEILGNHWDPVIDSHGCEW